MKTLVAALMLLATPVLAQQLDLPRPSLSAKVSQTAGLTDVTVDYSSPAVRGRQVFGGLVPYGEVWRTGANTATRITFSKEVVVGSAALPAGTYALFTIPGRDRWTFIVNKDAEQWGAYQYRQGSDVVRVDVTPQAIPHRERMAFVFSDASDEGVRLDLEWDKTRVSLPIKVGTAAQALASITALEKNGWRTYNNAAQYLLDHNDGERGLKLAEISIRLHDDALNEWTKARILHAQNKSSEARAALTRAQELASKDPNDETAQSVKKALGEWK
jgi:hypothetical protein